MKFYELSPAKRRALLKKQGIQLDDIAPSVLRELDHLSENVIGQLRLPVGLVQNVLVNGQRYQVPLATEEPSVVAAANHGANLCEKNGGFAAVSQRDGIYGQIVLQANSNFNVVKLRSFLPSLITSANAKFASLVKHGGGVRKIDLKQVKELVFLKVLVDTAESMGANRVNAILEFMAHKLATFPGIAQKLFAILSNYPSQITRVKATIPGQTVGGLEVAQKIALLSKIGRNDPLRAATNNKGIMNGIDAVLLATGNDSRAVEVACGVLASQDGSYRSLSDWKVKNNQLMGQLTVSLPIGTVGGSIGARADVKQNYRILGQKITSTQLANITAAIGLANNLAALLAISTSGIQKGHMKLQARNIVAGLDATSAEKQIVLEKIVQEKEFSQTKAEKILKQIREENNAGRN